MAKSSYKVESGIQLLARLNKKPTLKLFYPQLFQTGLKPGEVVEIIYNEGTPKCLLTDVISAGLLPSEYGGAGTSVLIFNCSGNFHVEILMKSMCKKIISFNNTINEQEIHDIIQKHLFNLFIIDIFDANQYYITIYNLENILVEHPNITMILIDTITSFYWSEQSFKIMKMDMYLKRNLSIIQNVTKEHGVTVFYTKPHYFYSGKDVMNGLEAVNDFTSVDGVDYRITVMFIKNNTFMVKLVSVKTSNMQLEKHFFVNDDHITWL